MLELASLGKIIVAVGVAIVLIGVAVMVAARVPGVGRLPGDLLIQRDGITFYFPILSCLILSIILTIIANVVARLIR